MSSLEAAPAVFTATIEIVRANTGAKEIYELVGIPLPADESAQAQGELPCP
jgi:hypothetical protein